MATALCHPGDGTRALIAVVMERGTGVVGWCDRDTLITVLHMVKSPNRMKTNGLKFLLFELEFRSFIVVFFATQFIYFHLGSSRCLN